MNEYQISECELRSKDLLVHFVTIFKLSKRFFYLSEKNKSLLRHYFLEAVILFLTV